MFLKIKANQSASNTSDNKMKAEYDIGQFAAKEDSFF